MYSFNIHSLHDDAVFYSYPEANGKIGFNEVASFLFHCVDCILKDVHIFCESAGGQSKKFTIRFLHYLVYQK